MEERRDFGPSLNIPVELHLPLNVPVSIVFVFILSQFYNSSKLYSKIFISSTKYKNINIQILGLECTHPVAHFM